MYMLKADVFRDFLVERKVQTLDPRGRPITSFVGSGEIIRGVLAKASHRESIEWTQTQHRVTHTIVQRFGTIKATEGDRLVLGKRFFYVQDVDDVAERGYFILYRVEERSDLL